MIQLINKMKRKDGFTLVELIVVLVILAILAAFTIPAMLGYISDAREKAGLAEARSAYIAAQATVDSYYGPLDGAARLAIVATDNDQDDALAQALDGTIDADGTFVPTTGITDVTTAFTKYISGDLTSALIRNVTISKAGKITGYTYVLSDFTYTYDGSDWAISDTTTANATAIADL